MVFDYNIMTQKDLFEIYVHVAECGRLVSVSELAESSTRPIEEIAFGVRYLERAGLLREHIRQGRFLYRTSGVEFVVFDATEKTFLIRSFDEALCEHLLGSYREQTDLTVHENLQQFVTPTMSRKDKRQVSFCLLPPSNFDAFCKNALPKELAVTNADAKDVAERMRKRYFVARLERRRREVERRKARREE